MATVFRAQFAAIRMDFSKSPFPSTNLKPDNLLSVYGERVFSRLIDGMNVTVITLGGRDLRALARLRK